MGVVSTKVAAVPACPHGGVVEQQPVTAPARIPGAVTTGTPDKEPS